MNATDTTRYRVIQTTTIGFDFPHVTESTAWSGTDTLELIRRFEPSDIFGADPLGYSEREAGYICTNYRFERQLDDGEWEKISDPRILLTPMITIEQVIDEKNRRLFPGDYIAGDVCHHCELAEAHNERILEALTFEKRTLVMKFRDFFAPRR